MLSSGMSLIEDRCAIMSLFFIEANNWSRNLSAFCISEALLYSADSTMFLMNLIHLLRALHFGCRQFWMSSLNLMQYSDKAQNISLVW